MARLLSYWQFNTEADGGLDAMGHTDGTLAGAAWVSDGIYEGALHFSDWGKVNVPAGGYSSILNRNAFTVAAWVRADSIDTVWEDYDRIVNRGWSAPGGWLLLRNAADFGFFFRSIEDYWSVAYFPNGMGGVSIDAGQWHFVVGVFDGVTATIYVDGIAGSTVDVVGTVNTLDVDLEISDIQWSPDGIRGTADEVAIFDAALTHEEVIALFEATLAGGTYFEATVASVPPSITSISGPSGPQEVGDAATYIAVDFVDPDAFDTHEIRFDWGDGTTESLVLAAGARSVSTSHSYTEPGIYVVGVIVTDDDGEASSGEYCYVVIYDVGSGFVTGGGSFDSPQGSYPMATTGDGRASIGYLARYGRRDGAPLGNTSFVLHGVNFEFHSSAYDWLVIADGIARYAGVGTVNGAGEYGFLLSALDGDAVGDGSVDRIRMKIWDTASGEVVYDSGIGADEIAAPETDLSGQVVIHQSR